MGLAVEECGDGDLGAAELLGDGFKGERFRGFGVEEGLGGGGKAINEGGLSEIELSRASIALC